VKNHDFTPKKSYFTNFRGGGAHEIFGVLHVKNHDFTPKKSYFFQFYGGAHARCVRASAPAVCAKNIVTYKAFYTKIILFD
jgi:hypothetical protein